MSIFQRFIGINQRVSDEISTRWPYYRSRPSVSDVYLNLAATSANREAVSKVVDVGAGRDTPYVHRLTQRDRITVVGVDVLAEDLEANEALDVRIPADVVRDGIPGEASSAQLVTSRMVVEHVADIDGFASNVFEALEPGGRTVHLFAARYSVFAVLNRLLPEVVAQRVLFFFRPAAQDVGGFVTHYDRTHDTAAKEAFERAGFVNVRTVVSYNVSSYFGFFAPLFIAARIWENTLRRINATNLGAYVVLTGEKPEPSRPQSAGH